jgi:hypothetical protein
VQHKAITAGEQLAEVTHRYKLIMQDQSADEARIGCDRQLMRDREGVMQREHDRQIELIGRQDESVKLRAREVKAATQAGNGLRQIGYDDGLD